jgi:hypothetical protein
MNDLDPGQFFRQRLAAAGGFGCRLACRGLLRLLGEWNRFVLRRFPAFRLGFIKQIPLFYRKLFTAGTEAAVLKQPEWLQQSLLFRLELLVFLLQQGIDFDQFLHVRQHCRRGVYFGFKALFHKAYYTRKLLQNRAILPFWMRFQAADVIAVQ